MPRYSIGLDFGTLSARALAVDMDTGESESFEHRYRRGTIDVPGEPEAARQDADDYLEACENLLCKCAMLGDIVGIGIDATASTPIPVTNDIVPLSRVLPGNPAALAWLWKDHSSQSEASDITQHFASDDPARLRRVGKYYAEWFWAKVLRCARNSPETSGAAATWVEQCDFVTAALTGSPKRGKCAAGHKALFHKSYPSPDALAPLHPELARIAATMGAAFACSESAGTISAEWCAKTGLAPGVPVAVGGVDAHLGAVGAGVGEGRVCLVLGTSACHIAVAPYAAGVNEVPGISGIADDSVLPGMLGLEAGQAAFGDLFDWAAGQLGSSIERLTQEAQSVPAGSNGVLVLDFHSGNRCPLADARLAGVVLGQSLATTRAESFRAFIEASAMGIRQILDLFTSAGVPVTDLIACGGVAEKNDFVLQTIADVTGKTVYRGASAETVALGAAMFGAVVGGVFEKVQDAQDALCKLDPCAFAPSHGATARYDALYPIWTAAQTQLGKESDILKRLLEFRDAKP